MVDRVHGDVMSEEAPRLSDARRHEVLRDSWGFDVGVLTALPSERDLNVMVDDAYVLKVTNPAEPGAVIEMEVAAMAHVAEADPGLPVPRVVPTRDGDLLHQIADDTRRRCLVRLITVVPGQMLEGLPITEDLAEQVGRVTARMSQALAGFFHPAAGGPDLDWDPRQVGAVARRAVASGHLTDDDPLTALVARLEPALAATRVLPAAVQHADITLTNVLVVDGAITGLVDFGDMHHTPAVADLAASLTSVLRNTAAEQPCSTWRLAGAYLRGYQRHRLLSDAEVDVLGELILARMAVSTLISRTRADVHVDNTDYITRYDTANERVLGALTALSPAALAERFHRLAGTGRPTISAAEVPARRAAAMGGRAAPLFYRQPLHIVAGDGPWLIAADGRRYLDAYNNVAVLGHGDPVVTNRTTRQLNRLNTNSRYLHAGIVELAERLLATMPDGLDTCLFTTSGTEANELAWRLATEATGGDGALIVEHSYHGTTKWMADLSSNEWPPGHRPAGVARFPAPRGAGQDAETAARGVREAVAELAGRGHRPALLLADSGFTSEGVHDAPADWFHGLADATHDAGALYLADEVQIGYGRTGPLLWRFRQAEVTPDFVTLGKPMGAGYPIGAMLTRRDLVDRFAEKYEYFSTFAATPVAAAAGLAVLDVLADRELPQQAVEVGAHLAEGLATLADTSPLLGEVRGVGLVVGVDIVAPHREGLTPRDTGAQLLELLVERGALAGLTGPGGATLKVRPPLVWEYAHADLFVGLLADAVAAL